LGRRYSEAGDGGHRLKGPTGVGAVLAAELKLWKEP
jgi:hypothetical protein